MPLIITIIIITAYLLIFPHPSHAQGAISQEFGHWNRAIGLNPELTSLEGIINTLIPLIIVLSGLILLIMLIAGGFQMLTSAGNPEGAEAGKKKLTSALIGFVVIFAAYWIIQFMEVVLGVNIFGTTP